MSKQTLFRAFIASLALAVSLTLAGCHREPPDMTPDEVARGTRDCISVGWKAVLHTNAGNTQYVYCAGVEP